MLAYAFPKLSADDANCGSVPAPASPVVKWAGGKGRLLAQLTKLLPQDISRRRYVEPFAGGAALYFALRPGRAVLRDVNAQLMSMYRVLRDDPEGLIASLRALARAHSEERYYAVRARYNREVALVRGGKMVGAVGRDRLTTTRRAAAFVYLNKTCFNGLHRVNKRGEFNVPVGRYSNPMIVEPERLRGASRMLQGVDIGSAGFETVLEYARPGDFLYLDPPYLPTARGSFTAYAGEFGPLQHKRLAEVFRALDRRGCAVMLSNSDARDVRELYRGYRTDIVRAPRAISCNASARRAVHELVIRNY